MYMIKSIALVAEKGQNNNTLNLTSLMGVYSGGHAQKNKNERGKSFS